MTLFLAFVGVSLVVIMTPGPDTAITIRNTLFGGRAGGIFTALGIACGLTIWAIATSAGIVALLVASEPLFLAVKYAGAAYLVVSRHPCVARSRLADRRRQGAGLDRRLQPAPEPARRLPARPDQRPRQPQDSGLLREPAAAIRAFGRGDLLGVPVAGRRVRR